MRFKSILILILTCLSTVLYAQEKTGKDTLDFEQTQNFTPMILTGQYNPQSVDKSVFEVEVISHEDIKQMAGITLDDVLKQTLNLNITPNAGEGRSGIEQFGFNSEYIKILVDGIPVIGDEGFGNAIDISQINLDDIEQIEIVEGAMGVQYGANAVTGVINIITKKSSNHKWNLTPYIQEESIGNEYNWSDEGRHIQSLKASYNFSDNWYAEASYTRNDFRGFFGDKKGRYYFNPENPNDKKRGYDWLPKIQNNAKALVNYHKNDFRAFYKFEYFDEETDKFSEQVHLNENDATQTFHPTANDDIFRSERFYHHLNLTGKIRQQMNYDLSLSYQEQKRNQESFTRHLKTGEKSDIERFDYNTRKGFFSRGTLNHILNSDNYDFEIGYEINSDKGSASGLSEQNTGTDTQNNKVNTYSAFASAELNLNDRLAFRPGFRYINSNKFSDQYAVSFSGKYQFDKGYQLRAIIGTSPKLPNFEQLYFYMVDSNHDVRGNENLKPEKGKSAFVHLKKTFFFNDYKINYQPKFSVWYLDVKDKIDLIIVNSSPLSYEYNNIDKYRTWGMAFRNKFNLRRFSFGLGVSLNGESKIMNSEETFDDSYLYSLQIQSQLSYRIPKWHTVASAFFKYNGANYQYFNYVDDNGDNHIDKAKQDAFSWLNASIRKSFLDNQFEVTIGARNLLDVKDVKTASGPNVGHSGGESSALLLGYGRSYFLKLMYNLNF